LSSEFSQQDRSAGDPARLTRVQEVHHRFVTRLAREHHKIALAAPKPVYVFCLARKAAVIRPLAPDPYVGALPTEESR
jgi:phage protein D